MFVYVAVIMYFIYYFISISFKLLTDLIYIFFIQFNLMNGGEFIRFNVYIEVKMQNYELNYESNHKRYYR